MSQASHTQGWKGGSRYLDVSRDGELSPSKAILRGKALTGRKLLPLATTQHRKKQRGPCHPLVHLSEGP